MNLRKTRPLIVGSGNANTSVINVWDSGTWDSVSSVTYSHIINNIYGSSPVHSCTLTSSGKSYAVPITALVKEWLRPKLGEGGFSQDYGFILRAQNSSSTYKQFSSANNTGATSNIQITYNEEEAISNGIYYIRAKHSGHYLDAEQNMNNNVIQYSFHGNTNQQWQVTKLGGGLYQLKNLYPSYNGKVLDVSGGTNANGQNIQVYTLIIPMRKNGVLFQTITGLID